jgi:hypothetical protein
MARAADEVDIGDDKARPSSSVEAFLNDWPVDRLAERVVAADRLRPGYARQVADAIQTCLLDDNLAAPTMPPATASH